MRLVISRNQKAQTGMFGGHKGMTFLLSVRAQLTPEEQQTIAKYKVEDLILVGYEDMARFFQNVKDLKIGDLSRGMSYEVSRVDQLLAGEERIKEACALFKTYLVVMASFGGEEVIEY